MTEASKIANRFLVLGLFVFVFFGQVNGNNFLSIDKAEAANITLSGTLYTDEGVTVGVSGKTIKIAVGTSTVSVHSTTTATGGTWQITNIDNASLSTTTPFTVWLDGDANDATTMVMGYSGSNITSIPLYYAFTIANATSSTATLNASSYSFYDVDDDADILYKVTATSTIVSSDLLIKQGIFSAPTTTLRISGNYKNSGTYTNNYGSIFLTGASKTLGGTLTGTSALYNLNVTGSYTVSTTSASTTNIAISSTGSLTASSSLTVASNFANQGTFNSNSGTIYMENAKDEVMTYLKGVDAKGDNTGTGNVLISGFAIKGDYLYVAKGGNATACSQTVGAAGVAGCELQVYDISSTTNPVFKAGRDALGDATGATGSRMYALAISGNYLYVGKANNANPCSQTAGNSGVIGCELQVYDISSSTNPIYVAGRDASGDSTGVGNSLIYSLAISGNYLYVVKSGSGTACSQTVGSAIGCELMVFDISSSTNPIYVAGRDARGDSTGAGGIGMKSLFIRDNYLYVGKGGSVTNCSQTAGAVGVQGCELMVFDISSTTNPVYKAGRDASGDTTGAASADGYLSMVILDNYLYLGKDPDAATCTQVAGSVGANGCEIQVYDISSSTNPLYKAGRDSSGSSDGIGGVWVSAMTIVNNQLYVAKDSDATACSQTAGFAEGCELMVFDISSTTNPLYIVGRDDSGSGIGTDVVAVNAIINNGKYIYIGKDNDATACDQTAGSAQGCELMIFDTASGFVSGTLNATSSFNNITVLDGLVNVVNIASTTNFSVSSGATFVAPSAFTVVGNYTNNGTASFNEENDYLYVSSTSAQTLSGTLTGSSILPNTIFSGSGTKTFSNNASTTNFTINSGATVVSPTVLTVAGDYTNNGTHTQTGSTAEIKSYIRKYLTGRDISGSSNGIGNDTTYTMAKSGNYLYIGKEGDVTACSQTAGSAIGCELMVFDISTPDSPTYVAGRDVSGSATGTGNLLIKNLIVNGNYLYVGKAGDGTACSQIEGSAIGCELMVFDISSTTNPIYVVGRDTLGDSTGTSSVLIYSLAVSGNYLYVAKNFNATACSQTAGFAEGCELMVFDISSPTNPIYKAGRDSKGDSTGVGANSMTYINIVGNYLYVGKGGYGAFACSQTAGSVGALACELMVFDISSTTNPIYVAGRDSSGSSSGTGSIATYFVTSSGNTLYLSKGNDATACSQTAGSAIGCELMVFDISSSTNPTYVAGRDSTGDSTGVGNVVAYTLAVGGNYLYAGKYNDATACSQTAGSAIGCEIMVFDISSSTNPTYVAGRDSSGLTDGTITAGSAIAAIVNAGDYLYVSKGADAVACSQTVGLANGCELMVFDIASNMSGTMTGSSAFNNLSVYGSTTISSNASTSNLFIATSSVFTAPSYLTVSGDLSTYGSFNHSSGTIILSGTNQDLVSPATTTFYNLTKSVTSADTLTFTASSTYVVAGSLTLNGAASNLLSLRSSASGTVWYINPQATTTVSYVDVKDSNNINVTAITCSLGCVNSGNNTNWDISSLLPLLSGIIYSGVGVTEYTTGGNTIKVVVNGTSTYTDTLDGGSGAWSVNADVATGSVVTIYVDGDPTFRASLVTRALNVGNITNLNLYKDYLIVRSEDGTSVPITNDTLGTYDSSDDSDIQFTATSSTLIQPAGQSLYVYSNTNYLPNGEVTVGKSLIATSTAVTDFSTTTFNFIATSTATVTATTTFGDMNFNSATGDWIITSSATTTNFTILDGTTTAPSALTVTGNFSNADAFNSNSGTLYIQNVKDEVISYLAGRDASGSSAGTSTVLIYSLSTSGNYLYVTKNSNATACSQTAGLAIGCELMVFDISSSTNPTYVAGRDASGDSTGIGNSYILNAVINGNYLYVGKSADATACSQTAGSAIGCELMVFDISSSTNPTYVAGRDASGDSTGVGSVIMYSLAISGNNLYVSKSSNSTACSQTAGSAIGCELMVFDISSSTNPTYVAGRDASGDSTGVGSGVDGRLLELNSNYLFLGKSASTTACSQTAGSAIGCELMVFDISSSTNPVYVAGRDVSGDDTGVGGVNVNSIVADGNYLFVSKGASATACSQTAGSAIGCELMVFDISSSTNPVYVAGRDSNTSSTGTDNTNIYSIIFGVDVMYVAKGGSTNDFGFTCGSVGSSYIKDCELQIYNISSSTNPVYVKGLDSSGTDYDTGAVSITDLKIKDSYLYLVKSNSAANACSQTAGLGAYGCDLMVFDISSTTNPIYVAGQEVSGDSTAIGALSINSLVVSGNYLYIGKGASATACSQTAGSAIGCELMVFDISSSTNPVYVAGRDVSGDNTGIGSLSINNLTAINGYLYIGKGASATACSQTAGLAIGCELMVFDISSSTNPNYIRGEDSSGNSDGTGTININNIFTTQGQLYIGKGASATACSQTAGGAEGCELMVFDISSNLSGTMTGTSDFNNLTISGSAVMSNNASTSNLFIATSSTLVAPSVLTVAGDLSNYGTYTANSGTVVLSGTSQDLVSPATTTFYALTKSVTATDTLTFTAGGTYVFGNTLTLNGASGNLLSLRSSSSTGEWYIDPQSTTTLSYLDVQDSNNINVTTVNCDIGCLDSGRNTNWGFADPVTFVSADNYHFYVGQASTTLDQITLTKVSGASDITATNDLRIAIATTTTNFRFSTSNTSLTFGGTASGKVSGTVSYENSGATLLINVTSDFIENDTLTINGIQVGSFGSVSATSSRFALYTSGSITGSSITDDTKVINITGSLTLSDHTLDQVDNQFSFQNKADEAMFAFRLVPSNENATITDMVFTISGLQGIDSSEFSDFKIYRDLDSDSAISAGDQLLDSSGIMTINGQHGAITFSSDFLATSSADYIMTADTTLVDRDDTLVISLPATGITAAGVTSAYTTSVIGTPSDIQHQRHGAGAGGSSSRIGDDAPAGNGVVTGGDESGGGGAGQGSDGENIASDPDFLRPSANGDIDNQWTNPANAYNSDGVYATAASATLKQSYSGFGFNVPGGNTIQGIAVKLDASGTTANGTISVALSWDGGSSYTTGIATPTFTGTDVVYTVGGSGNTWGRSWTATEFNPANFRLRVTATPVSNTVRLDALEIKIFHQAGGGGAGGGGI